MILKFEIDIATLNSYLSDFIELLDRTKWDRRSKQLSQSSEKSPFQSQIINDYHWLEFSLAQHLSDVHNNREIRPNNGLLCALLFCQTVMEVYKNISPSGQKKLAGRLRACLKTETGFSPLYIEMAIARTLFDAGYEVEFTDIENTAQYDLKFWRGSIGGEIECKSISCDAGRKIHRKDFYRFIDEISKLLQMRAMQDQHEIILITLKDRFPQTKSQHTILYDAIEELLLSPSPLLVKVVKDFFEVELLKCNNDDLAAFDPQNHNMKADIQKIYGQNCHVAGAMTGHGTCMVIMRSRLEDDTSEVLLDTIKKASSQFSKTRPGFITIQFDDIEISDILSVSLRRRVGILANYSYLKPDSAYTHVAAISIYAYRGLAVSDHGIGQAAFSIANPRISIPCSPSDYKTFLGSVPDDEFAKLLGQPALTESISKINI